MLLNPFGKYILPAFFLDLRSSISALLRSSCPNFPEWDSYLSRESPWRSFVLLIYSENRSRIKEPYWSLVQRSKFTQRSFSQLQVQIMLKFDIIPTDYILVFKLSYSWVLGLGQYFLYWGVFLFRVLVGSQKSMLLTP